MPVDIITVGFCPQYFSAWRVAGSRPDVTYDVTLDGAEHAPSCSCPAFRYSGPVGDRTCKHVRKVWEHGCLWNPQWRAAGPNDWAEHGIELVEDGTARSYGEPCPGCGHDLVPVKIAV